MSVPVYHQYDDENLNKENLINNDDFINDAAAFLGDRGGYSFEEIDSKEKVYDAFMEHFRFQNVNEVTALKDLSYSQETDDEGRARMGRLMDTFDRMDSDLGFSAAGDYLEGVFTAPSTYFGVFTGGAGKAGMMAANTGVKIGIREAIKRGGLRTAAKTMAVEAPVAAGTVLAQEQTRVETGIKEDIDPLAVTGAGALATITGGLVGGGTGTHAYLRAAQAEEIVQATTKADEELVEAGYEVTKRMMEKDNSTTKTAKKIEENIKLKSLEDTIPEELATGRQIKEELAEEGTAMTPGLDQKMIENISAASARIYHDIKPRLKEGSDTERVVKGSAEDLEERFTSRIVRGIRDGDLSTNTVQTILKEHGVTAEQIATVINADVGALVAEEVSRAGKVLRGQRTAKDLVKRLELELNEIDDQLLSIGDFTSKGYRELAEKSDKYKLGREIGEGIRNINKARIGLMTVQTATTVRNTTNGYMRNYVSALDNLGTGLIRWAGGNVKRLASIGNKEARDLADKAVAHGRAQMRVGLESIILKDLILGMDSATVKALERLMRDENFGASKLGRELFRDMGDVGEITGAERGILGLARKMNTLNTMSDNMFKRAVFARELDILIRASSNGKQTLASTLKAGKFRDIPEKAIADAMEKALDFTYQTGKFKGKDGFFNTLFDTFIQFGQTTGGSLVVPFPRYMVNQFRFVYEHAPIFGLIDAGGILNKSEFADRAGKQLTGLTMLGTFAAIRTQFGDETTGPYEYLDPTSNDMFDMRASLGPFAAYAMFADYLYRKNFDLPGIGKMHDNDRVASSMPYSPQEFVNAITGGQGRAGTQLDIIDGVTDVAINGIQNGLDEDLIWESMAKTAGSYLNTFTVGAGVIKDAVATVDPSFRQVPDNTDVSLLGYMLKQATRSFPQTIGDREQQDGIFGYTGLGPEREALESPTRSGGLRAINPFIKQLTGLTPVARKNTIEKEFDRLGLQYFEISPRAIKLDAPLTNRTRGMLGKYMEQEVAKFVLGEYYQGLASDTIRRRKLKNLVGILRREARSIALDPKNIDTGISRAERNRRLKVTFLNSVSADDRSLVMESYKAEHGTTIEEDDAWGEALELVNRLRGN